MTLIGKKHPKIKLQRLQKKYEYGHLGRRYIKLTLSRGSGTNFPQK